MKQATLSRPVSLSGIGLHSGEVVNITIKPAPINHGIVFFNTVMRVSVPAHYQMVEPSPLCTTLVSDCGSVRISTVEHILSALSGCMVDNALIEIDGSELPIMDGSAAPFVQAIVSAGLLKQSSTRRAYRIMQSVHVNDGEKSASLLPSSGNELSVTCRIDFNHSAIGSQTFTLSSFNSFGDRIARARTFGFQKDVDTMRKMGLARGGSLENAVVFDDAKVLNPEGMRYQNECVRHKVLDAIGDLYLAGLPLIGDFYGYCSGHFLNYRLLQEVFANPDNYEEVLFEEKQPNYIQPLHREYSTHPVWA